MRVYSVWWFFFCFSLLILISVRFELLFLHRKSREHRLSIPTSCRFSDQVSKLNWRSEREFVNAREEIDSFSWKSADSFSWKSATRKDGGKVIFGFWTKIEWCGEKRIMSHDWDFKETDLVQQGDWLAQILLMREMSVHYYTFFTKRSFVSIKKKVCDFLWQKRRSNVDKDNACHGFLLFTIIFSTVLLTFVHFVEDVLGSGHS